MKTLGLIGGMSWESTVPYYRTINQTVKEQLQADLEVEKAAIERLNRGIELSRSLADNGSRELLEHILVNEEEHADWLEAQLTLIEQVGEPNYLAQQIKNEG